MEGILREATERGPPGHLYPRSGSYVSEGRTRSNLFIFDTPTGDQHLPAFR